MEVKQRLHLIFYRLRYKVQEWKLKLSQRYEDLDKKGRERLTIMVIPHTDRRTINFVISYKAISVFIGIMVVLLVISAVNVLSHSGSIHQLTELNLTNKDFIRQSSKMKEEVNSLHETIQYYYERISNLYIKLGGDPSRVSKGMGGQAGQFLALQGTPQSDITDESFRIKEDIHNLKLSSELSEEIIKLIKKRKSIIRNTPSIWPTKGYVLFPFGKYISPVTGKEELNRGLDIGSFPGAEVIATAPGIVFDTGYSPATGYYVKLSHRFGWKTIYSNLDRIRVKKNEKLSKGDILGYVGKSPENPIYHLHYEVHVGTQALNPFSFLNQIQE
ncbi:M23 family metallopeptidase [Leptospira brenneri]|uniref:M23 family metallopeptidase n=1 Tax=Leptospira brenneri TaxID=2023182 RepID=A0A5F1Z9X6_9LEPT|nr:M23 family metallopeptidase [Leptospira brenneri]TGK96140.1 M23 family metallopeptidase [Leptospira brenneri]